MKKTMIRFLPLLASAMIFAGCGGAAMSGDSIANAAGGSPEMMEAPMEAMKEEAGLTTNSSDTSSKLPEGRKLIRRIHIDAETDDFDTLVSEVSDKVSELSGYIEGSELSGSSYDYYGEPNPRYMHMTIRIPADKLSVFVEEVDSSCNIIYKSENTEDVTLQYVDTESRKKSLEVEEERIFVLLEQADSIETIVALEERLSEIRYQLQSLESSLRVFDNQVDYSTVNLSIQEVKVYTPVEPESIPQRIQKGFLQNLEDMSIFLVDLAISLIISTPFWIPLLLLIILIVKLVGRKRKAKKQIIENAKNLSLPAEQNEKKEDTK